MRPLAGSGLMSQALGPEKKMRLDTCIPWVALFALFVSTVNLGMYILSRRELQAVRIAEKRNEILILIYGSRIDLAEVELGLSRPHASYDKNWGISVA